MEVTEEAGGPPQRKEARQPTADLNARGPPRAEIPSGLTGQPSNQHARTPANCPPDMAARETSEAPDTGQPGTGLGGPTPGARHAADPPRPPAHGAQTTGHAGTAPSTAPAYRNYAGTPGDSTSTEAPGQGPTQAQAASDARATKLDRPKHATDRGPSPDGHTCDEDSFDAFMESCRSAFQNGTSADCPAQPPGAARQPYREHTPRGVPPGAPPARLQRLGAGSEDTAARMTGTRHTRGSGTDPGRTAPAQRPRERKACGDEHRHR